MSARALAVGSVLAVLASLCAGEGRAAGAPDMQEQREQARQHYERGRTYHESGAYDKALEEYQRAYEIVPLADLLFDMAQVCQLKNDRPAAIRLYQRYVDLAPGGRGVRTARAQIVKLGREQALVEAVRPPAATAHPEPPAPFDPPASPPPTETGAALAPAPPEVRVATATPAPAPETAQIEPAGAVELAKPVPRARSSARHTAGVVLTIAGATCFASAGALLSWEIVNHGTIDRECQAGRCTPAGLAAVNRGQELQLAGRVLWATGGVAALTAAYLLITGRGYRHVAVAPALTPRYAALVAEGRF
jgi:tetratricopeptide (TPR) repeat protein